MNDVSVFDAMELDNTNRRVASRRALALAHNRVERNLGRFLRGAQTEEEFLERLGLVEDDFAGYVSTAAEEVGHEHPEHIAAALKDHYRLAADHVEFKKTPEEEVEEEDEKKEAATKESLEPGVIPGITGLPGMNLPGVDQPGANAAPPSQPPAPGAPGAAPGGGVPPILPNAAGQGGNPDPNQPPAAPGVPPQLPGQPPAGAPQNIDPGFAVTPLPGGGLNPNQPNIKPAKRTWSMIKEAPGSQHLPASPKRNRQYEHIKDSLLESGKSEDRAKEEAARTVNKQRVEHGETKEGKQGHPLVREAMGLQDDYAHELGISPEEAGNELQDYRGLGVGQPRICPTCGYEDFEHRPGEFGRNCPYKRPDDLEEYDNPEEYYDDREAYGAPQRSEKARGAKIAGDQISPGRIGADDSVKVSCPECGGSGKTAGDSECPKCHGGGKVQNFGESVLDKLESHKAADGNTDLDGPEPKMDKGQWTRENPGEPKVEDGVHKTERKDPVEVIGPMRNDHELKEIGDIEHKDLPSSKKEFADNNMAQGPHTKTFGDGGQVDPVTNQALASAYLSAIKKEAMGMSAMDFRMLADAIRTAPEGADKPTLANHVAQYLSQTNPMFDAERFLAAASGDYQSGRDKFKGYGQQPASEAYPSELSTGRRVDEPFGADTAEVHRLGTWPSDIQVEAALAE